MVRVSAFVDVVQNSQEITHERNLVGCEKEVEDFVRTMADLDDRLGPLLVQLPPSFTVEGMGVLEDFLKSLPDGFRYAVEVRHRSWLGSDLPEMLRERGAALALIDYPRLPRMHEATADFSYIRWLGDRREFPGGTPTSKRSGTTTSRGGRTWPAAFSRTARLSSPTPTTTIRTTRPRRSRDSWSLDVSGADSGSRRLQHRLALPLRPGEGVRLGCGGRL
jgi:hypothetical protein